MQRVRLNLTRRFETRQTEDAPTNSAPNAAKKLAPSSPCRSHPSPVHGCRSTQGIVPPYFWRWTHPAFPPSSCAKVRHVERARRKDELYTFIGTFIICCQPAQHYFQQSDSSRVRRTRSATSPPRVWQRVTFAYREFSCLSIDSLSVFYSTGKEDLGGRLKRCDRHSSLSTRRIGNTNTIHLSQRRDLDLGSRRSSTQHEAVTLGGCEQVRLTGLCPTPDLL